MVAALRSPAPCSSGRMFAASSAGGIRPSCSDRLRAMGVLDEAIRAHLDLKRRHGAPEEELRRQEDEALGPARREMDADESPAADEGRREPRSPPPRSRRRRPPWRIQRSTSSRRPPTTRSSGSPTTPRSSRPRSTTIRRMPPRGTPWRRAMSPALWWRTQPTPRPVRQSPASRRRTMTPRRRRQPRARRARGARPGGRTAGRRRRRGRPRGHARVPPGDPGARPPLVRAEAAPGLRLRLILRPAHRVLGRPPAPAAGGVAAGVARQRPPH